MAYTLVLQLQRECYSLYPTNGGGEMGDLLSHITGTVWLPLDGIVAEVSNRRSRSRHLSNLEMSTIQTRRDIKTHLEPARCASDQLREINEEPVLQGL
jgi:hypothetical protein